jgi:hypothetical protein
MITVPIFIATLQNVLMEFPDLPPNCLQRTPPSSGFAEVSAMPAEIGIPDVDSDRATPQLVVIPSPAC